MLKKGDRVRLKNPMSREVVGIVDEIDSGPSFIKSRWLTVELDEPMVCGCGACQSTRFTSAMDDWEKVPVQ